MPSAFPTFGDRVRFARTSAGLSQSELASRISDVTKTRTTKGLISQWEANKVSNPQNSALLALSAVTGFALHWIVTGDGPQRAELPALRIAARNSETRAKMRRAIVIAAREQSEPEAIADAAVEVFETLQDEPNAPEGALRRIARLSRSPV